MGVSIGRASTLLVWLLPFLLPLSRISLASPTLPSSTLCRRHKFEDAILVQENQCPYDDGNLAQEENLMTSRVAEVNGTTFERAVRILQTRESMYVAVLVYAKWCPFSEALRPVFDSLSSAFPSVYHFAVEEAALQTSAFSHYYIHSFPALFLHNKTEKVRYHGARTFEGVSQFYKDFTGLRPLKQCNRDMDRRRASKKGEPELSAKFLERGFNGDVYLMLSTIFLISRVLFYLLPRLLIIVKQCWAPKGISWQAHRSLLQRVVFCRFEQERPTNGSSKSSKGKSPKKDLTQETGKVLLSVPGWSSSPLAAVTLAEGSSSRTGNMEDACDNGHTFGTHLWG